MLSVLVTTYWVIPDVHGWNFFSQPGLNGYQKTPNFILVSKIKTYGTLVTPIRSYSKKTTENVDVKKSPFLIGTGNTHFLRGSDPGSCQNFRIRQKGPDPDPQHCPIYLFE
jgi:hypothetical protein